jgi:magnesium-transporting ATPase (P-type)
MAPTEEESPLWHGLDAEAAVAALDSTAEGLSEFEASDRLQRHGPNQLPPPVTAGPVQRLLRHFHDVLIYVLLAAAIGTLLLQHWVDAGVILGVVVINAVIGFIQEGRAERALDALRAMLAPKAQVLRAGQRRTIPAEDLVPGDIVFLQAGDKVPADLRLIRAHNLRIDEAALTGESVAVDKQSTPTDAAAELADQSSMAFSGTLVSFGQGRGVVVATGADTQVGRISAMLSEVETLTTPLLRQMAAFGRHLSIAIVMLAALTFAFGYWVRDYGLVETFMAAVSLAVAAIPEGLPAIMTITLAIGVQRMARRNAVIRRLPAVETLGSVTVICSDKTGTLTRNEMTVRTIVTAEAPIEVSGIGYEPHGGFSRDGHDIDPDDDPVLGEALHAMLLCNDAEIRQHNNRWTLEGDPTEGALVTAALKGNLDHRNSNESYPRDDVLPFEAAYKFMATLHHHHRDGSAFIYLKGAPESVLALCTHERTADGKRPIEGQAWQQRIHAVAERGERLLALATRETEDDQRHLTFDDVETGGLTLIAVCGITDPPREEVLESIQRCHSAGIDVKMITGDHAVTARAIARELEIGDDGHVLSGHDIERTSDAELQRLVRETHVFARCTPEHKLRLVKAIQAGGGVVSMTGDGVNDAPALKRADVGVSMGLKGTEAAREASAMVLADDNFASIAHAVEEGRTVYDNLKKAILFVLPTNGSQAMTIVAAIAFGATLPLTPVQVLWVNMVTAVTLALALAFEPPEPGAMQRPPRPPGSPILSGFLIWRIAFVSLLLLATTFGHFLWMQQQGAADALARTVAINTLVVGQAFYLLNSRYILRPVIGREGLLGNRTVWIAVTALAALQLVFTYAEPLNLLFETMPIGAPDWARILGLGVFVFVLVEIEKAVLTRLGHADSG